MIQCTLALNSNSLDNFLAIFVLVIHGVVITAFGNWWLNIMLTFFWGVGIMNAINLFDNMDG
ncbi:MAG: hypothetical protein IPH02_16670 [Sphingobacteriales bacterium]|nr:hypothetical protein [Sphingobacteriales bacterium]